MTRSAIKYHVYAGRLHRLHRGVFAVGTASLSREGRWLAAVLACGSRAALSHLSAAALWRLWEVDPVVIDVIAPRSARPRDGLRVHRVVPLRAEETTIRFGIPVTSPERTWFDLAGLLGEGRLRRALSQGEREGLLDPGELRAQLRQRRGIRGQARGRAVLDSYRPAPAGRGFRSELEREFWEAWVARGFEEPLVNHHVAGIEVDMSWPSRRLIVELDGEPYHRTHEDRARDRRNAATLRAAGWTLLRFSDKEVGRNVEAVVATVFATYEGIEERVDSGGE